MVWPGGTVMSAQFMPQSSAASDSDQVCWGGVGGYMKVSTLSLIT